MPDFKQLAEGEKPTDPERYILIEVIHEPAIGHQYSVTGKGLDPDHQPSGDFTHRTLEEARTRAPELAKAGNVPIIYLSSGVAQTETEARWLGRVDGFDEDEAQSKRDERAAVLIRLLAA